jgi:hypothetical protein
MVIKSSDVFDAMYLISFKDSSQASIEFSNIDYVAINQNFFASVTRAAGSDAAALTGWRVDASAASPIQLYVEDVGGV